MLGPGGHFMFNCWGPLATHDVEATGTAALAEAFPGNPPSFLARVPHGYHDADRIAVDLTMSGFGGVHIDSVELEYSGRSAVDLARGSAIGSAGDSQKRPDSR